MPGFSSEPLKAAGAGTRWLRDETKAAGAGTRVSPTPLWPPRPPAKSKVKLGYPTFRVRPPRNLDQGVLGQLWSTRSS